MLSLSARVKTHAHMIGAKLSKRYSINKIQLTDIPHQRSVIRDRLKTFNSNFPTLKVACEHTKLGHHPFSQAVNCRDCDVRILF